MMTKLNRRQFLKLAGVVGGLALPTILGYDLLQDAKGEIPSSGSPYAEVDPLKKWPSTPRDASPILLLINEGSDNPFGLYLAEILRAEGLNSFQVARVSDLDNAPLEWFDLVLLAEGPLNGAQADLLEAYVNGGGRLVATRPDVRLAALFGLERMTGSTADGYLQVNPDHPIGRGAAREALQFHGIANHYRLAGATALAWLLDDAQSPTGFPALTTHRYGQGQAALWAFDLSRSIAYTRQGNPAWADQERDRLEGFRACDMFTNWVDLDRLHIPQADEQQRLLANLLTALSRDARPLPRLWYFPGGSEAMLIATADSHGNPASAVEDVLSHVEQRAGHMSVYYTAFPSSDWRRTAKKAVLEAQGFALLESVLADRLSSPTPHQVAEWRARGHEFGLHPFVEEGLQAGWYRYWKEFTGLGYGPVSPTVRTHRVLWKGWVESARFQAAHGLQMNLDFYHVGPAFQKKNGQWAYGHFTGSGLPMKFVDEQGRILNIYQQLTQLADEHLLQVPWGPEDWMKLSPDEASQVSRMLLRRSKERDHSAIVAQFHIDSFAAGEPYMSGAGRWLEATLDCAVEHGIPIWSAAEWLHFTRIRHDAALKDLQWDRTTGRLSFQLSTQVALDFEMTVMLPAQHAQTRLAQIQVDGRAVPHNQRELRGVNYACVSIRLEADPRQVTALYA
jgi:hypothetical protein